MPRTPLLVVAVLVALGLTTACNQVDEDTALEDVPQDEAFEKSLRREFFNVLSDGEADCVKDEVFSSDEVNIGQVSDFAEDPDFSSPVFDLYTRAFQACVDLDVVIPPAAPTDFQRESILTGLRSSVPGITDDQANCLIDTLVDGGVGVREMTLSGYLPEVLEEYSPQIEAAGVACLGPAG